jgi:Zn-dependent oligopeptidase
MSTFKPLCPCCFQAYSAAVVAGQVGQAPANDGAPFSFGFCGTCAPSSVEKALAKKAENDTTVPPIQWLLTVPEIEATTKEILEATQANLDAIAAVPLEEVTFDNTIRKLMTPPNYKTNPQLAACKFLQHASTDPAIRQAASAAAKQFSASRVQGRMRGDIYERVKAFSTRQTTGSCAEALTEYQKHFVKAALQDFERAGLALPDEEGQKLKDLLAQDSAVCSQYSQNLAADTTKLFFTPLELKGLKDDFIQERLGQDEEGKCTITLKYPDIIPIGQNCVVPETRRKVTEVREGTGAYKNNLDLVAQGIQLRRQIANLLGYTSWAEYICEKRMSGSYQAVDEFLTHLETQLQESARKDYQNLLKLKEEYCQESGQAFDGKLHAWDTSFYNDILLQTEYGVDSDAIRQYFPLDHVVETTLSIYQELLGLTFQELPKGTFWSWYPSEVRCFQVVDTESQEPIGHFYLDLHPREGKYGHAAIFHLVKRTEDHGAVDCMLCNLPAGTADKPSLLLHSNVETVSNKLFGILR